MSINWDKNFKKRLVIITGSIIMAILGALLFVNLFSTMSFNLEALEFNVGIEAFKPGMTQVEIPPIGLVRAHTHTMPLTLIVRLENIDLDSIRQFLETSPNQKQLLIQAESSIKNVVKEFAVKVLFLGSIGGAFGVFLIRRNRPKALLKGALIGLLLMAVLLAGTYNSFDINKFINPEYEGVLKFAPWMVGLAEEALGKINLLSEQMNLISENLFQVFKQVEELKPLGESPNDIKVLHVSDIHNNPAGLSFIEKVAGLFNVNFIIDTGDISDFGTPLEALLLKKLEALNTPYLFIAGNHDSPSIIEEMQNLKNVEVINGYYEINGITIAGFPAPSSNTINVEPLGLSEVPAYAAEIKDKIFENKPHILAVHNYRAAKKLTGAAPVIMFGHNHEYSVEEKNGSILVDAGTSGAAGLRGLEANKPYTVVLLHFRPQEDGTLKLVAADIIKVLNLKSGFSLERKVFEKNTTAG